MMQLSFRGELGSKQYYMDKLVRAINQNQLVRTTRRFTLADGNYKAGFVGSLLSSSEGCQYETFSEDTGIPSDLALIIDIVTSFHPEYKRFAVDILRSIPVSVDLSQVAWEWLSWLIDYQKDVIYQESRKQHPKEVTQVLNSAVDVMGFVQMNIIRPRMGNAAIDLDLHEVCTRVAGIYADVTKAARFYNYKSQEYESIMICAYRVSSCIRIIDAVILSLGSKHSSATVGDNIRAAMYDSTYHRLEPSHEWERFGAELIQILKGFECGRVLAIK